MQYKPFETLKITFINILLIFTEWRGNSGAVENFAAEIVRCRLHNRAIIYAVCKMKFEPVRFREKEANYLGSLGYPGMAWRSFVLNFFYYDSGEYKVPGHLSMIYYDNIVQGDSKQDFIAVASLLEAGLFVSRRTCPQRRKYYW